MNKLLTTIKENKLYLLFSFCFIFFQNLSFIFYFGTGFGSIGKLCLALVISLLLAPILTILLVWISNLSITVSPKKAKIYTICFYFVVLFLSQLPAFFSFYPGIIFYDIGTQIEQYETHNFVANHPLLHTLFMGYMKNLFEDVNKGYALATIIQLIGVDCCLAYIISSVRKYTNTVIPWILVAFYSANPIFVLLFISSTKDIIFSALICVAAIDIYRLTQENVTIPTLVRMIITGTFMILMRSNAKYAVLVASIVLLIFLRKKKELFVHYLAFSLAIIILSSVINSGIIHALDAYKGSIKEMLSIPAQIDARIYNFTDKEADKETVLKYIEEPERYRYYISDPVKEQLTSDTLDSTCKHFLLDSAILSIKHPVIATEAVLYNTQGYWDIFHSPYQEQHHYLAERDQYRGGAKIETRSPYILHLYYSNFVRMQFKPWNLLAIFAQIGIYCWILIWILLKSIKQKNRPLLMSCLFLVIYLLTLLLGPAAIMRYGLPFIIMAPVLLILSHIRQD